jgi:tRNA (guanosine-2'-O-)-methyltransferase
MRSIVEKCLKADRETKRRLLEHLEPMITEMRKERFAEVLRNRTRFITIVLEDIFQPHNASAVLRTCDCFGVQDVHIIENKNRYEVNPDVALGSSKWLSLYKYSRGEDNTSACLARLKEQGYRIIAATPRKDDFTPHSLPVRSKFALLFGTELYGLSDTAIRMADSFVRIPMFGFTESFNISVSAAILLHTLTGRIRQERTGWQLSEEEMLDVRLEWAMNSLRRAGIIASEFLAKQRDG